MWSTFEPNLGQTGKIGVPIKELILVVLLHFDELDGLVGDRIGEDTYRVPCGQSKFRVIPIARKARITPKSSIRSAPRSWGQVYLTKN